MMDEDRKQDLAHLAPDAHQCHVDKSIGCVSSDDDSSTKSSLVLRSDESPRTFADYHFESVDDFSQISYPATLATDDRMFPCQMLNLNMRDLAVNVADVMYEGEASIAYGSSPQSKAAASRLNSERNGAMHQQMQVCHPLDATSRAAYS